MGSEFGYKYAYTFSLMDGDEDEIRSKYKSVQQKHEDDGGFKTFLFDIRTNFHLLLTDGSGPILIDSERFDASIGERETRPENYLAATDRLEDLCALPLSLLVAYRLQEYWITFPQIIVFSRAALDFAKQMAARPQNTFLTLIPVVVTFQVCTVQGEGESYEATMDRVICNKRLVPLYLWPYGTTVTTTADHVSRKPIRDHVKHLLTMLPRTRNKERLDPDWVCFFCSRKHYVGAQITRLECRHAFHSHCIFRWLEGDNACPKCGHELYFNYDPSKIQY